MASSYVAFCVATSADDIIAVCAASGAAKSEVAVLVDHVALLVVHLVGPGGVCSIVAFDDVEGT